ncbi:uncharacterized protein HMPREF1541_03929 [Cyphellophora europaea CBS 101466]|uniref:Zn(2)-C6 fungal-type domain-containing protein n=1 Tax=Cyphellophora europaea (strain CBS 101466) TaxID=1220924 RepID=W2S071_CYPE1|nr:uncharacterized protein HMPREF1541_03929 [Cyphellophora europaea CBS 101466]ETN41990.1 hypothetical protein HMPREF1541_03929 [Cyphellophora europaea CBS 101466]
MGQRTFYGGPIPVEKGPQSSRVRQWHSKTRTGCDTCKRRRVKCTEERPVCRKCSLGGRDCIYLEPPKAKLFEPKTVSPSQSSPTASLTPPAEPEEQRALQFFNEKTALAMATFTDFTKRFWQSAIPQVAATEHSVRHMTIALASRQERNLVTSSFDSSRLERMENKHYALGLSALTRNTTIGDVEVILLAGSLFIAYGNFERMERQSAQELMHMGSIIKILHQYAARPGSKHKSDIIDSYITPMFVRLELIYSLFMMDQRGAEYNVIVEPLEPEMPRILSSLLQARQLFVSICCYRHHAKFRGQAWHYGSPSFLTVRQLFLTWHRLVTTYQAELSSTSEAEQQRILIMLSQFRLLYVAFVYSARIDLHKIEEHLRPARVELLEPEQVVMRYDLPGRYVRLLAGLDWESKPWEDPMQVRLWPVADITHAREESASMTLKFYV